MEALWDIVKKCKKKATTQESGSNRWMINESGNYSTLTNLNTPTSGDIGYSSKLQVTGPSNIRGRDKL